MSRRRRRPLPKEPVELTIDDLSHDGRGVGNHGEKKIFVHGALPDERVLARLTERKRNYDEGEAVEVLDRSVDRVEPLCPHFGQCGGCSLQHLHPDKQIAAKQNTLEQNLERIGKVTPDAIWEPLTGPQWGYRRKARLSVRYVHKKERVLVGFRERYGRFVADMQECHVLDPRIAAQLENLAKLIYSMDAKRSIPQLEVSCGDDSCALVFRHLEPLSESDLAKLRAYAKDSGIAVLLQPSGPKSIHCLEPESIELAFGVPEFGVSLAFGPSDFIQVNAGMNRMMIARAVELLQPGVEDRVLDLFCGLGNFTLPIATLAGEVVGIEGDAELVRKAVENAQRNGLRNATFHAADLNEEPGSAAWLKQPYDKILVDPPRSGAEFILPHVAASGANRLVYVSCHPASLARDAGILVHQFGFRLAGAGVMDMFPQTGHVESIALFERS
ncbi:MAG: 23S rRNA (uracil(1939)-C(5))-methyltransferase RlmD [Xanthomonadales bacterium]|nr:23S rRNA (uracil(1939)-C(5))-methyltransferase RlmD [Gammaproteobacteria bacterium]MBT8053255.1 23S rRNA (uracil(1939)-C(5))-methyltransferase RlmD [Gammaproteobacteria bacterium]NND56050.1 23S rRNA (uracil(1939)-C(5))-methyltransferase RlmD [Xanthomonadales bacterium]NNK50295.1 23S rRNA (uracil(1939)-C(5))-methyltransferase RlmD [Xanthomonadales bacterium]